MFGYVANDPVNFIDPSGTVEDIVERNNTPENQAALGAALLTGGAALLRFVPTPYGVAAGACLFWGGLAHRARSRGATIDSLKQAGKDKVNEWKENIRKAFGGDI